MHGSAEISAWCRSKVNIIQIMWTFDLPSFFVPKKVLTFDLPMLAFDLPSHFSCTEKAFLVDQRSTYIVQKMGGRSEVNIVLTLDLPC